VKTLKGPWSDFDQLWAARAWVPATGLIAKAAALRVRNYSMLASGIPVVTEVLSDSDFQESSSASSPELATESRQRRSMVC
jgi:hypothetical protein